MQEVVSRIVVSFVLLGALAYSASLKQTPPTNYCITHAQCLNASYSASVCVYSTTDIIVG